MRDAAFLRSLLQALLAAGGLSWPEKAQIGPARDEAHGDLATNVAMLLGREAGMNPRELAAELAAGLLAASPEIARAEAAGPGFLNVFFTPAFWQQTVPEVLAAGEDYGQSSAGAGQRVMVEYVSANPTGPLHIGHGRGAAVGDSLTRILRFAGFEAATEYYINDAGRQMRLLGESVLFRLEQILGPEDGDIARILRERLEAEHLQRVLADDGARGRHRGRSGRDDAEPEGALQSGHTCQQ